MSERRLKSIVLIAAIVTSGLTIIAWTQTWFTLELGGAESGSRAIGVGGETAAGGLSALGLAGLALVGALSIAGPVFRAVLGALQILLGATITLSSVLAIADPVRSSGAAVTESTGVSGGESIEALVDAASATAWPFIASGLGVVAIALGIIVIATSRRWPVQTRKYQAVGFEQETPGEEPSSEPSDSVTDWDTLSDGGDPTSR